MLQTFPESFFSDFIAGEYQIPEVILHHFQRCPEIRLSPVDFLPFVLGSAETHIIGFLHEILFQDAAIGISFISGAVDSVRE